MQTLKKIYFSLPVQLFIMNLKRLHVHLFVWIMLFNIILEGMGKKYGIPYLLLDPEYLGKVGFSSFFWIGASFAGFFIAYNITSYILYSRHFPFLGGLKRPFSKFVLNNSLIPLLFVITYVCAMVHFQLYSQFKSWSQIILQLAGFFAGQGAFIILSSLYFYFTNTDIFRILRIKIQKTRRSAVLKKIKLDAQMNWQRVSDAEKQWKVLYYLESPFRVKHTSESSAFDLRTLKKVLEYNQLNAVFIQLIALITILILGAFRDYRYMQIPAGASILIVFSMLVMLSGAFSFWLKGWQASILLVLILLLNYFAHMQVFNLKSAAYGIDYTQPQEYSDKKLHLLSSKENFFNDKDSTILILENWKKKTLQNNSSDKKPLMVFIANSGGGQRAALFSLRIIQAADSLTKKKLFRHTMLISGASGGILGATYFREIYLKSLSDKNINPYSNRYLQNISKDALNAVSLSIAVNDLFIPFQKFHLGKNTYRKDRGYALEMALNKNTEGYLDKKIGDYKQAESAALIPMVIFCPTIINDGRKLYISPQPVSYLTTNFPIDDKNQRIDGVEFRRLFHPNDPDSLKVMSAIRMNATFPYITPNSSLPSEPVIQVNDAGVRDNLGAETALRFIYNFKEWIKKNTSGIVLIQIRDTPQNPLLSDNTPSSVIGKLLNPVESFYKNWERFMQYQQEDLYAYLKMTGDIPCHRIVFQYIPENIQEEASLSWHLTSKEKMNVIASVYNAENRKALAELEHLFR